MKQTNRTLSILLAILMLFSVATTAFAAGGNNPLTLVSAKVGDLDLEGAKISPNSEIVLTFSNNVTDSSVLTGNIGKIKVKDSTGTDTSAAVSPGSDKTVFIVTIGSLAKGDYTLTIGKELAAKNGSTLGTKVEFSFEVNKGNGSGTGGGNGESPLELVSVKVGDKDLAGAELEPSGTITITFSRGMDENQAANFEKIGIFDKDGKKVANVSFSDFQKPDPNSKGSYTVLTYKNLATGEYTLKLDKDLKANNGNTLEKAETITFTVKDKDDEKVNFIRSLLDKIADLFKKIIDFFKGLLNK